MLRGTHTACAGPSPKNRQFEKVAVRASHADRSQSVSNGAGPHRLQAVQATVDDINKGLATCIKEAAAMSSLEKINKGIGTEISKAAVTRYGK